MNVAELCRVQRFNLFKKIKKNRYQNAWILELFCASMAAKFAKNATMILTQFNIQSFQNYEYDADSNPLQNV
jgi:thermostable 8-oxoguanine DNA glycosylase